MVAMMKHKHVPIKLPRIRIETCHLLPTVPSSYLSYPTTGVTGDNEKADSKRYARVLLIVLHFRVLVAVRLSHFCHRGGPYYIPT